MKRSLVLNFLKNVDYKSCLAPIKFVVHALHD